MIATTNRLANYTAAAQGHLAMGTTVLQSVQAVVLGANQDDRFPCECDRFRLSLQEVFCKCKWIPEIRIEADSTNVLVSLIGRSRTTADVNVLLHCFSTRFVPISGTCQVYRIGRTVSNNTVIKSCAVADVGIEEAVVAGR
jgi:hypothetical protein